MSSPGALRRIASLDGLRAFAIACAVWHHALMTFETDGAWFKVIETITPTGDFGVQIFFVLSGFLITSLLLKEREKTGKISLKDFYRRRAYRIFPALYVFIAIVTVLTLTNAIDLQAYVIAAAAFFVRDYVPTGGSWWLGHTWSLAIEEQFYLLWPLVLILVPRRLMLRVLFGAIVCVVGMRTATWLFVPQLREGIMIMFHTRSDALMIGAMLAVVSRREDFQAFADRVLGRGLGWVALAWFPITWIGQHAFGQVWRYNVGYLVDALAIAVVMTWAIKRPRGLGGRVLNWGPICHIGAISYSLYLYQQLFLAPLNTTILGTPGLNVLFALLAAEASFHLVERPFLRLRDRKKRAKALTPDGPFDQSPAKA